MFGGANEGTVFRWIRATWAHPGHRWWKQREKVVTGGTAETLRDDLCGMIRDPSTGIGYGSKLFVFQSGEDGESVLLEHEKQALA